MYPPHADLRQIRIHPAVMPGAEPGLLNLLRNASPPQRLLAAASIKHSIIGNRERKLQYISNGAVPLLASSLRNPSVSPALAAQCAVVLASLASASEDAAKDVAAAGVVDPLVSMLAEEGEGTFEAARALGVLQSRAVIGLHDLKGRDAILKVMGLLQREELAAIPLSFISAGCEKPAVVQSLVEMGVPDMLVTLLGNARARGTLVGVLRTLGQMCEQSMDACRSVVEGGIVGFVRKVMRLGNVREKIAAVGVLSVLFCHGVVREETTGGLIAIVVELLRENTVSGVDNQAVKILARLLDMDKGFCRVAFDCCAADDLVAMLERYVGHTRVHVMNAMGRMAYDIEEARESMNRLGVLKHLLDALSTDDHKTVISASFCLQSLTRSAYSLQDRREMKPMLNQLLDELLERLLHLAASPNVPVQRAALRALCNVLLVRAQKLLATSREEVWLTLVDLTSSTDKDIRLYAVWALKNMFFRVKVEHLASVQKLFERCNLLRLCRDSCRRVREEAMSMIRNLTSALTDSRQSQCVEHLVVGLGEDLFETIELALTPSEDQEQNLALQALHVICNFAASDERHKRMMLRPRMLEFIAPYLTHEKSTLRVAATRIIINLAWPGRWDSSEDWHPLRTLRRRHFLGSTKSSSNAGSPVGFCTGAMCPLYNADRTRKTGRGIIYGTSSEDRQHTRIHRLVEFGLCQQLQSLREDPHVEVRLRVKEVFELLGGRKDVSRPWISREAKIWSEKCD